jgi:hypothetical protein
MASLPEEFAPARPTLIAVVPRLFEKVFNAAQQKAHAEGHAAIFEKAADVAVPWSEYHGGRFPQSVTDAEHIVFDQLVYKKIHAVFGGRLPFAVSGGGPLGERLTHFFNGVGVKVFEGYGLTETSPTLTLNRPMRGRRAPWASPSRRQPSASRPTARSSRGDPRSSPATSTAAPLSFVGRLGLSRRRSGAWLGFWAHPSSWDALRPRSANGRSTP